MKRAISFLTLTLALLTGTTLLSFINKKGGDCIEIYADGKQLLQQFCHLDHSVKTVQLGQVSASEKIEVYYSHCGTTGKSRVLTIKDDKNNIIKELKFADVNKSRDAMSFQIRDVQKKGLNHLNLYYTSKEIPDGKFLAILAIKNESLAMK